MAENEKNTVETSTTNILTLMGQEILENFLRGYTYFTFSGVSAYFKFEDIEGIPTLDTHINYFPRSTDNVDNFHPLCRCYRKNCDRTLYCIRFDKEIVKQYYRDQNKGAILYLCHRGVLEMAYPLRVDNVLLGVLFCGQIIIKKQDAPIRWEEELGDVFKYISLEKSPFDQLPSCQQTAILEIINNDKDLKNEQKILLRETLSKADQGENPENITIDQLVKRFKDFRQFGDATVGLLGKLYDARVNQNTLIKKELELRKNESILKEQIETDRFRNECLDALSKAVPRDWLSWQSSLKYVLSKIRAKYNVERVGVFYGQKKSNDTNVTFNLFAMNSSQWWSTSAFTVTDDLLQTFSKNHYYEYLPPDLYPGVGENPAQSKSFWVFTHINESTNIYTLVLLQNNRPLKEEDSKSLCDLLEHIYRRDAIVRLNFREKESHEAFGQHVIEVRHGLKTSVQLIIDNVEGYIFALKLGISPTNPQMIEQFKRVAGSINNHVEEISKLNHQAILKNQVDFESVNVYELLKRQVELFLKTAESQKNIGLPIFPVGKLKDSYLVFDSSELSRGYVALLDNAIKYSFDDLDIHIICSTENNHFQFTIINRGIGIPPNKLQNITKKTVRANVIDSKKQRTGQGLGLYIARQIFEEKLGGTLEITSKPLPNRREDTADYHWYQTEVKVTMPVEYKEN